MLAVRASTSIVLRGLWMWTGTVTSRSIVKDLCKLRETSKLPAGLSGSLDAKEGERLSLFNWELSMLDFTSGAEPFAGTPLEGTVQFKLQSILSTDKSRVPVRGNRDRRNYSRHFFVGFTNFCT